MISKSELQKSKSSMMIVDKGLLLGQITENTAIFKFNESQYDVEIQMSLIAKGRIRKDFSVVDWYNNQPYSKKDTYSKLFHSQIAETIRQHKNSYTERLGRILTIDTIPGESKNLIGYVFSITSTQK